MTTISSTGLFNSKFYSYIHVKMRVRWGQVTLDGAAACGRLSATYDTIIRTRIAMGAARNFSREGPTKIFATNLE